MSEPTADVVADVDAPGDTWGAQEVERRFIAAIVWDGIGGNGAADGVLARTPVTARDFEHQGLARIFEVAQQLRADIVPVDQLAIAERDPGTEPLVWEVTNGQFHPGDGDRYGRLLAAAAARRRVAQLGPALAGLAKSSPGDLLPAEVRARVDGALTIPEVKPVSAETAMPLRLDVSARPSVPRYATPWPRLDRTIGGFRPGGLYVLGARPGVGKSVLALQIAAQLAGRRGPVAFASLEMSRGELLDRVIAQQARIPFNCVEDRSRLTDAMQARYATWRATVQLPIHFDDTSGASIDRIRRFAESVPGGRPAGVVVDYLQLIPNPDRRMPRQEHVANVSRELKIMAGQLGCPVIALSQLNREVERRGDGRPNLADLRESGAIEQDADVVLLLHRPKADDGTPKGFLEVIVAKNRHGEAAWFELDWQGEFVRAWDPGSREWGDE